MFVGLAAAFGVLLCYGAAAVCPNVMPEQVVTFVLAVAS